MGTASSSLVELPKNDYLQRFVSKEPISHNDPFWNQLLSFTFSPPKTCADYRLLEESIKPLLDTFLLNNPQTGNLASLVKVFLTRAVELKASAQCENSIFTWQTYNALFILRSVIKYIVQTVSEEGLVKHLSARAPESQNDSEPSNLLELLITTLVEILVDVPVINFTYAVHLESINSLLVLLSIQMFSMRSPTKSTIYRSFMHGKCSIHAFLLTKTLLNHFIKQEKPPTNDRGGSIILGIASGLWSVLTLGYGQKGANVTDPSTEMTLAKQSLLMLLILVNHCTNEKIIPNPYREALFSFGNIQDPSMTPADAIPAFKLDYQKLYEALCTTLQDDQTTLLFYLLLHRNLYFKNFILSRMDIEALVVPILKVLYQAQEKSSHLIYMTLIILLILSEDDLYNEGVHDIMLKNVTWYTERMISEISLGGLLVLVVIRTIQYNMTRMRDKYLHTNCLAALANMSSHFKNLHPYVCQRFVSLFENLAKRLTRIVDQLRNNTEAARSDSDEDFSTDLMYDLSVLEEVLRMVLEILNSTLTTQLQHNPNLLYTLLYKRHVFEAFRTHPTFQDIIQNLDMVLAYFSGHLEAADKNLSVSEVSCIIQQAALHWPQDRLRKFPELKFKYVEEEQPEEFFIPYIWSLVYNSSNLYWSSQNIILFNPNKTSAS